MQLKKEGLATEYLDTHSINDLFKDNLESLITYGVNSGADFVEIFIENIDNMAFIVEQDIVTSVNPSIGKGVGIRVL